MTRPHSKNRFVFLLFVTVVVGLALYLLHTFEPTLQDHYLRGTDPAKEVEARVTFETIIDVIKVILWMILAIAIVRALADIIFGIIFRRRLRRT